MNSQSEKKVKFHIHRFNPESCNHYISTYTVHIRIGTTILDALLYIKDNLDGTLTFRHQCRMGQCGSCGVIVNDKPMLACYTQVLHLGTDTVTVQPLTNFPVIKDLVVNLESFFKKHATIEPILIRTKDTVKRLTEFIQTPRDFKKYWDKAICIKCSLCNATCPAEIDIKFLGPSSLIANYRFIVDTRDEGRSKRLKKSTESIWLCTSCHSCTLTCPKEIDCSTALTEERSLIIEEGVLFPKTAKDVLDSAFKYYNPIRLSAQKRNEWGIHLNINELPIVKTTASLYFVGCLSSYDDRNKEIAKAMTKIFRKLNVDFATLGNDEWCCGDHILRLGEKGLFEMLAEHNVSLFKKYTFENIVTISPHCYYTFTNDKPYTDMDIEVMHYTQFLAEALNIGKLKFNTEIQKKVTYHDPCFLGKRSNIYDEPREILRAIPGLEFIEMRRSRENSFCCGGGAGRVWTEEADPEKRPSVNRVNEAIKLGVQIIVTACPFCITTLEDAIKTLDCEDSIKVMDLTELISEAIETA
jgi:succinate dehydrogenase/fumarate reductase iron-sulfur protein